MEEVLKILQVKLIYFIKLLLKKSNVNCPTNTGPITLLKTTKNSFLIVLYRNQPYLEKYLSNTQAALIPARSTTDIL